MKIGFCVEGSTDRALLEGLRQRWCRHAELVQGRYRGRCRRREIPHACLELQSKGADLIVMLRDANNENWRDVQKGDRASCSPEHGHLAVFSVCDRNVECWLTADRDYAAGRTNRAASDFDVPDPKKAFEAAMGITSRDRKVAEIVEYVQGALLRRWLANGSFEDFYDQLWRKSREMNCAMPNLRAGSGSE